MSRGRTRGGSSSGESPSGRISSVHSTGRTSSTAEASSTSPSIESRSMTSGHTYRTSHLFLNPTNRSVMTTTKINKFFLSFRKTHWRRCHPLRQFQMLHLQTLLFTRYVPRPQEFFKKLLFLK